MPYVAATDGCQLFYRAEGAIDAPAIIFSNSLGTDHMMWQPQADVLRGRFRVVRYDQRGHGASDVPGGDYELGQLGRDIISIAEHLGIETFSFCGLSMGGLIGQWLGAHAPMRLEKLILANTSAHFPPPEMWIERMNTVRDGGTLAIAEAVLGRFFTGRLQAARPDVVDAFQDILINTSATGYLGCCAALMVCDLRDDISRIIAPTLVVSGAHDQSTPPDRGDFLATEIKGAQHILLDAAHMSNIEQTANFNRALVSFLTGRDLPDDERYTSGISRRRKVLGKTHVDRALTRRSSFNGDFQDLITRYAWGEIWNRPGLDEEARRLLVLAITASLGRWEEFELHAKAALEAKVSLDAIRETLMQTAIYAGVPAANTAFAKFEPLLPPDPGTSSGIGFGTGPDTGRSRS